MEELGIKTSEKILRWSYRGYPTKEEGWILLGMYNIDQDFLGTMGAQGVYLAVFIAYFCSLISSNGGNKLLREFTFFALFLKLRDQKYWFDKRIVLMSHTY